MERATTNGVWRHRFRIAHTTERRRGVTSASRLRGYATGQEIYDRGLRLAIAVEPVVGDHAARKHDANPQDERESAGNPGRAWRFGGQIPGRNATINAGVKDPDIHAGEQQHNHFGSEENIHIRAQRYGGKQERAADDHEDESDHSPRQKAAADFGYRDAAHAPAEQAEVKHHSEAEKQAQGPNVNRFDQVVGVAGFVKAGAPGGLAPALKKGEQRSRRGHDGIIVLQSGRG